MAKTIFVRPTPRPSRIGLEAPQDHDEDPKTATLEADEHDEHDAVDMATAAGARCHGDELRSPRRQLHGAVGDQRRSPAATGRSAWL